MSTVTYATCAMNMPAVQTFISEMHSKYHFDKDKLNQLFCKLTIDEEVIARINKPYEAKPWYIYRELFLKPIRINKGVAYWKEHEKTLALAEERYGVPASIIVAIIGVETQYGDNKGTFPVFNTLATLAFNHSRRADFFRSELKEYLLLTRENNFKPLLLKGSYAGAMGLPQFMPSSYRHYAVDFYNKGNIDLINNDADAIGSVANYLHKHGWQPNTQIAILAKVPTGEDVSQLKHKNFKPTLSKEVLDRYGITSSPVLNPNQKASLIELQDLNGKEYWLGLQNFYVISTYNKSELYVMAVNLLAQKIREKKYHLSEEKVASSQSHSEIKKRIDDDDFGLSV